jgi:hypothetical protein
MAKKTMLVSDISGQTIEEGQEAVITIKVNKKAYQGDATAAEVEQLVSQLKETKIRGRRPASS